MFGYKLFYAIFAYVPDPESGRKPFRSETAGRTADRSFLTVTGRRAFRKAPFYRHTKSILPMKRFLTFLFAASPLRRFLPAVAATATPTIPHRPRRRRPLSNFRRRSQRRPFRFRPKAERRGSNTRSKIRSRARLSPLRRPMRGCIRSITPFPAGSALRSIRARARYASPTSR